VPPGRSGEDCYYGSLGGNGPDRLPPNVPGAALLAAEESRQTRIMNRSGGAGAALVGRGPWRKESSAAVLVFFVLMAFSSGDANRATHRVFGRYSWEAVGAVPTSLASSQHRKKQGTNRMGSLRLQCISLERHGPPPFENHD
jgi:hypothetical protein